jgi:rhamnosyltransferase
MSEIQKRKMSVPPTREHVCAVFVTYHPDKDFPSRVTAVKQQVAFIVIVDNGSDPTAIDMLRCVSTGSNVHLILNHDNLGIATALNQGVRYARSRGYSWALTFDQDTEADDKMVLTLLGVYAAFDKSEKIAVLGSRYRTGNGGNPPLNEKDDRYAWVEKKDVITSGSLVSIAAFDVIGPFRDRFFIDHVDTEYCLRARSKGFKVIMTRIPVMRHVIGASSTHLLLWKRTGTTNHSPLRRYYNTRNLFVLVREYLFREPNWTFCTLYSWAKSIVLVCLFERERLTKLKSMACGVLHGLSADFDDR